MDIVFVDVDILSTEKVDKWDAIKEWLIEVDGNQTDKIFWLSLSDKICQYSNFNCKTGEMKSRFDSLWSTVSPYISNLVSKVIKSETFSILTSDPKGKANVTIVLQKLFDLEDSQNIQDNIYSFDLENYLKNEVVPAAFLKVKGELMWNLVRTSEDVLASSLTECITPSSVQDLKVLDNCKKGAAAFSLSEQLS